MQWWLNLLHTGRATGTSLRIEAWRGKTHPKLLLYHRKSHRQHVSGFWGEHWTPIRYSFPISVPAPTSAPDFSQGWKESTDGFLGEMFKSNYRLLAFRCVLLPLGPLELTWIPGSGKAIQMLSIWISFPELLHYRVTSRKGLSINFPPGAAYPRLSSACLLPVLTWEQMGPAQILHIQHCSACPPSTLLSQMPCCLDLSLLGFSQHIFTSVAGSVGEIQPGVHHPEMLSHWPLKCPGGISPSVSSHTWCLSLELSPPEQGGLEEEGTKQFMIFLSMFKERLLLLFRD